MYVSLHKSLIYMSMYNSIVCVTGQASFSMAELDEISRQVAEDWQRLAIYLGVRQDRITQICHSNDDIMTKSFRSILWWYEQGNVSRKALADALVKISKGRLASKVYLHV